MPKILVVDDDASIREMLSNALGSLGHQVTTAEDGELGLDFVHQIRPDLIFLDLMMPKKNGYEVLDALQADADLQNIPVIILTALNNRNQVVEGLQRGANDYITKPFNLQELLARANVQLRILELEEKIRQSEAYHRALFERASDPEVVLDATGTVLQVNDAAAALLECSPEQIVGRPVRDLVGPANLPEFEMALKGALDGSEIPIFEIHLVLAGDHLLPVDTDLCPVDIEGRRHIFFHLRDIRRRKAAETRSMMIFEHIGDAIFITNLSGLILLASRSAERFAGLAGTELVGQDIARLHSPDGITRWRQGADLKANRALVYEDALPRKDGQSIPVEWTIATFSVGSETYLIGVARDLADRRAAEEKKIEAERLQTLLEIAGGAAHEINQPLTAILGYAEMSQDVLEEKHKAWEYQQYIVDAALRINEILKHMQAVREYRTRPYANGHQIVDFEQSSSLHDEEDPETP